MQKTDFEVLKGLPAEGPWPEQFSATGQGKHREGYVVGVMLEGGDDWVGNFQPGLSNLSAVVRHPNHEKLIVIAGGEAYVVEPATRKVITTFGGQIDYIHEVVGHGFVVFANGLWFAALGADGIKWQTRRLSWDGMRNVVVSGERIVGEGWMFDESWHRFEVNLSNGEAIGGAYNGPYS